jgi:hypothetical protein
MLAAVNRVQPQVLASCQRCIALSVFWRDRVEDCSVMPMAYMDGVMVQQNQSCSEFQRGSAVLWPSCPATSALQQASKTSGCHWASSTPDNKGRTVCSNYIQAREHVILELTLWNSIQV